MAWPEPTEYNEAVQSPQVCFADDELRKGQPVTNALGLPVPCAGNFALVYQITGASGQSWAVKCFTREAPARQQRYQAISEHLRQAALPFMVDFRYLEQGIRVGGQWFPVVKMRWVEGFTLNALLREHVERPQVLQRLAQMWLPLAQKLRRAGIAHADLQHGNVLLVPSQKAATVDLRLIDYDGMFVPALAEIPSGEVGHPNYQHPQRLRAATYNTEVDRFAHLAIYTAMRCLLVGGKQLWEKYDNAENLLFREQDFKEPAASKLFEELCQLEDAGARALVGHLLLASQDPLERVPLLEDLVDGGKVLPLTSGQEKRVRELLPSPSPVAPTPVEVVAVPAPQKNPSSGEIPISIVPAPATESAAEAAKPHPLPVAPAPAKPGILVPAPVTAVAKAPKTQRRSALKGPSEKRSRIEDDEPRGRSLAARRRLLTLAIGGVAALCGLIVLLVVVLSGSGEPPPQLPPPDGPPAVRAAVKLEPLPPVTLKAGGQHVQLPIRVALTGSVGPVTVKAENLPPQVYQEPLILPAGQTQATLSLRADLTAKVEPRDIRIVVRGQDPQVKHEQTVSFTIAPQDLVNWAKAEEIVLRPGQKKPISLRLEPANHTVPLDLVFDPLPKIALGEDPVPVVPNQSEARLVLAASPDAPAGTYETRVRLQVGGTKLIEQTLTVRVVPVSLTLKVPPPLQGVGVERRFSVTVERQGCEGPVTVEAAPTLGVKVEAVTIPAGADRGVMRLTTDPDAAARVEVMLTARLGDLQDSRPLLVNILGGKGKVVIKEPAAPGVGQAVTFQSVDGVTLHGTFYLGQAPGPKTPCVLLLPALGESSGAAPWVSLAGELQRAGFAVLRFEYRGLGRSTRIDPGLFWNQRTNQLGVRGYSRTKPPDAIAFARFQRGYYPVLANDIAAAKAFLDRQSDVGRCNSCNLVLIGARDGATLGAVWLNAEHHRYRMSRPGVGATPAQQSEGRFITAVVWLTPHSVLGQRSVSLAGLLDVPARQSRLPIALLYAENDTAGKKVAVGCQAALAKKKKQGRGGIVASAVPGTAAAGSALLAESPDTVRSIAQHVAVTAADRGEQRVSDLGNTYMWIYSRLPLTQEPARNLGDLMVRYQDFGRFMR
jgi:hypothetical protein